MSSINKVKSSHRLLVQTVSSIAMLAVISLAMAAAPASARWDDDHHDDHHYDHRHGYNGGYYAPPAVVYGGPYRNDYGYAPPPVVYAPGIGIALPGVVIGIH